MLLIRLYCCLIVFLCARQRDDKYSFKNTNDCWCFREALPSSKVAASKTTRMCGWERNEDREHIEICLQLFNFWSLWICLTWLWDKSNQGAKQRGGTRRKLVSREWLDPSGKGRGRSGRRWFGRRSPLVSSVYCQALVFQPGSSGLAPSSQTIKRWYSMVWVKLFNN